MNNTKKMFSAIITACLAFSASLVEMRADPIIYASAGLGSQLIKIDVGTKQVTTIGDFGVIALGLAINPQGRVFSVTDSFSPLCPAACNPQLARVKHATGRAIPFGDLQGEPFMGIGFSPDGTLYGVNAFSGTPDSGSLYRFNLATGEATKVGVTGGCLDIMDLAWHPDGAMYGAAFNSLYRINLATGQAELVATLTGLSANMVMGLAIDDDGNFYVSEIIPNSPLYRVNPHTGATTKILHTGMDYIHGLEFMPAPRSRAHQGGHVK